MVLTDKKFSKSFVEIFELEHITAIISDCYWYIICRLFKPGQFELHEEMYLDRLATNYVSFTLHEKFIGKEN